MFHYISIFDYVLWKQICPISVSAHNKQKGESFTNLLLYYLLYITSFFHSFQLHWSKQKPVNVQIICKANVIDHKRDGISQFFCTEEHWDCRIIGNWIYQLINCTPTNFLFSAIFKHQENRHSVWIYAHEISATYWTFSAETPGCSQSSLLVQHSLLFGFYLPHHVPYWEKCPVRDFSLLKTVLAGVSSWVRVLGADWLLSWNDRHLKITMDGRFRLRS